VTLAFVHFATFVREFDRLGLTDEDLVALEKLIAADPNRGDVMKGTGGLRKIRFAPPSRHIGSSGGCRAAYFYFPIFATVYFFLLFAKNDQSNLTPEERAGAKRFADRLDAYYAAVAAKSAAKESRRRTK
jgi:hypothetical protein